MAKDNSFDIVSETDMQEVENAFNNTEKGLKQRYDLKDSGSKVDFDKGAKTITVLAPSDFVSSQVIDVLNTNLIKRKVDLKAVSYTHLDVYKRQVHDHRLRSFSHARKEYEREGPCQGFSQEACENGVEAQASPQTGSWQPGW